MGKPEEKKHALELRARGFSYGEIAEFVPVSIATLSVWLREVPLSAAQRGHLALRKRSAGLQGAAKVHAARLERAAQTAASAEQEVDELLRRGDLLWLIGTMLYWAEGAKPKPWRSSFVSFTNMDPRMIILVREWFRRYCHRGGTDVVYELQIHPGADTPAAVRYWAGQLGLLPEDVRVRLKRPNPAPRRKNVGRTYYGTMRIRAKRSTLLNHRIEGWVRGLVKRCGVV